MKWLTMLLEIVAIAAAVLGLVIVLTMTAAVVKQIKNKLPRRKTELSKDVAREGVTFNDIFMFMLAVPLVLLWVTFAGYVIWHGLQDSAVLQQIEAYTTLIAILGGPALLILKDALDVWKQEQAEKTAFYKVKAQSVIDYNNQSQKQAQMIEAKEQEHIHGQQNKKK